MCKKALKINENSSVLESVYTRQFAEELQNKVKQQYGAMGNKEGEDVEVLYNVALFVIEKGTCSINSIQPAFNFGFRRAQRIVDTLEEMGIVSGSKGTTGREILMTKEQVDRLFKMGE